MIQDIVGINHFSILYLVYVLLSATAPFFNDRNFRHLSGKYPHAYGNIATTKLIQCGIAEMPENKAFRGFCGFIFSFFEPVFC